MPDTLTIEQAVQRAVQWHPDIAQAIGTMLEQANQVDVAKAKYYPQISAGMNNGYSNSYSGSGFSPSLQSGAPFRRSSLPAAVSAGFLLFYSAHLSAASETLIRAGSITQSELVQQQELPSLAGEVAEPALGSYRS
ncbi:hypothetical protein CRX72_03375 [Pantoea sp. BRM17]|nr:hypothetical protein CRX72_03375 [Pantoea sp. BRM17]